MESTKLDFQIVLKTLFSFRTKQIQQNSHSAAVCSALHVCATLLYCLTSWLRKKKLHFRAAAQIGLFWQKASQGQKQTCLHQSVYNSSLLLLNADLDTMKGEKFKKALSNTDTMKGKNYKKYIIMKIVFFTAIFFFRFIFIAKSV